ncbi:MAG: hypothetical protein WD063_12355 [Pirellulales bacterium]
MRFLLFLAALVLVGLIITGAITLGRSDDQTITIQINEGRVKKDAAAAIKKGKEVLGGAQSRLRQATRDTNTN